MLQLQVRLLLFNFFFLLFLWIVHQFSFFKGKGKKLIAQGALAFAGQEKDDITTMRIEELRVRSRKKEEEKGTQKSCKRNTNFLSFFHSRINIDTKSSKLILIL